MRMPISVPKITEPLVVRMKGFKGRSVEGQKVQLGAFSIGQILQSLGEKSPSGGLATLGKPLGSGEALCFTAPMEDMRTGKTVGKIIDCLKPPSIPKECEKIVDSLQSITYSDAKTLKKHCGLELDAVTTFVFHDAGGRVIGSFVNEGATTVQPLLNSLHPVLTHTTGSVESVSENTITASTGIFEGLEASVRLSGLVGMKSFSPSAFVDESAPKKIDFDCIFEIRPVGRRNRVDESQVVWRVDEPLHQNLG